MLIYQVKALWAKRDFSLLKPAASGVMVGFPVFYLRRIEQFVTGYFWGKTSIFGITRQFATLFMCRWFLYAKYVQGFSSDVAWVAARANFKEFMVKRAGGVGWVAIGMVVAMIVLGVVFAVMKWGDKEEGSLLFPDGACILRYRNRLWWGGLMGRPRANTWDFARCFLEGDKFFYESHVAGKGYLKTDFWDFLGLWEFIEPTWAGWYTYRVSDMKLVYLGMGVDRGFGLYRFRTKAGDRPPFDRPVGWGIKEFDACKYLQVLRDLWV